MRRSNAQSCAPMRRAASVRPCIGPQCLVDEVMAPAHTWARAPRYVSITLTNACELLVDLDARFLSQPTHDGRPALEHGYAITAHAAQGLTCRHALVLARDEAYSEWIYTTMTRASDANRLYVVGERGRDRDEFAPAEPARDGRVLLAAALHPEPRRRARNRVSAAGQRGARARSRALDVRGHTAHRSRGD